MTNQEKGAKRDRLVIDTLIEWGAMDVTQLQILLYPSYRVAQRRLQKLVADKRIKRCCQTVPYSYYVGVQPPNLIRRLEENWVRLWHTKAAKTWQRITKYNYNTIVVLNTMEGTSKESLIADIKTPTVEKIKEGFKCVK